MAEKQVMGLESVHSERETAEKTSENGYESGEISAGLGKYQT